MVQPLTPEQRRLVNMVDPLTVIRQAARTAAERISEGDSVDLSEEIETIRLAAAKLNRMLNEMIKAAGLGARK
jgi:hypothetical protein